MARISTEGSLDRELGDGQLRTRLRAIRQEARDESARRELSELKQQMLPGSAAQAPPAGSDPSPVPLAVS